MDVFQLRSQLVGDYADYVRSFINIQDDRIASHVDHELQSGLLWPEPLLQLNPNFEPGDWIDDLVESGSLHPQCREIFRLKQEDGNGKELRLHRHQSDAVHAAGSGDSYVLTTGTGSGKSLAYIVPIVNYVLQTGSGNGIKAIIIYPMNALANSQAQELEKFLVRGFPGGPPVTFRRYTGQESEEERQEIITNPPDILLTNYVMLELLLTRPRERPIVNAARETLQFLVLDELHTYRGRQGADVALLVRRVRNICANPTLQCVGTSATLAGGGTFAKQQQQIAAVASRLFGAEVKAEHVIGETLRRATDEHNHGDPAYLAALKSRVTDDAASPSADYDTFIRDPLSSWIESIFGLTREEESGRLRRAKPIGIGGEDGAARQLAQLIDVDEDTCRDAIEKTLLAGYDVQQPNTEFPVFAFRLHQFISRGDTVYASLEHPAERHITTHGQQFVPGDRRRVLLPLAFCRECGQEYYTVQRHTDPATSQITYHPRTLSDQSGEEDDVTGFLYQNPDHPWPEEAEELVDRLPEDWIEVHGNVRRIRSSRRKRQPLAVRADRLGHEHEQGQTYHFVRAPFAFCLNCGVSYGGRQRSDYGKLASLSSEGRSTATTILSLATLRSLREDESLLPHARKLLSFTDNRQDASLQAGHFNDFVEVGMLRAAVYNAAAQAGAGGLTHEVLAQRVFDALALPVSLYAVDPAVKFQAKHETDRALREVLAYRVYQDLRRGWRVTSPNLEQCGLLEIDYASLDELCAAEEEWAELHPALATATPDERETVAKTLLDFLRRELVIKVDYLDPVRQESLQQLSSQRLIEPWAIDENEQMIHHAVAYPRSVQPSDQRGNVFVSGRGGFGLYLRYSSTLPQYNERLTLEETEKIIVQLFDTLRLAGLAEVVHESKEEGQVHGYQIPAAALIWKAGEGRDTFHDPIRVPQRSKVSAQPNSFFVEYYRTVAAKLQGFEAREHTAQVPNDEREAREERFRKADLPVLFCSPTMELGVDISQLNAVNMRNVPPTPANYAQRSGRAGRSGQPALVFTYCTTGSPHDQYFFKRPDQMVAGAVAPPRLDLANEDLLRAHVYAVWIAEAGLSLKSSLQDLLDLEGENPSLDIQPTVRDSLLYEPARHSARQRVLDIFSSFEQDLRESDWYTDDWLYYVLAQVESRFEQACERWRGLYRAALKQRELQNKTIGDASRSQRDKNQARRLRAEAEAQMELLTQSGNLFQSDFYSYRYFASEGFLPGYSFPRLPLSAYIPGRRQRVNDEFLNRPRFLAISEFGPRSVIYHEGSRYIVNKVILPVEERSDDGLVTTQIKLCDHCGHLHPIASGEYNPDRCEQCDASLGPPLHSLLRMQNVATRRRDRINSDEEERVRMGYDLITGVRFSRNGQANLRVADVQDRDGQPLMRLTYGSAAEIWRVNLGWRRRKEKEIYGFVLDTERGYWARNELATESDPEDPMGPAKQMVVPFVQDRRNCLLIEPEVPLSQEEMASLQPALKAAIQVIYQLEDNELAAEALPSRDLRNLILIYEAAEGGAGVLRQLFDDPDALATVAKEALRICHFDSDSGQDLRSAPGATEECEAACYDCLMSYYNQMDHLLLDRKLLPELLLRLSRGTVVASPTGAAPAQHVEALKALCDSQLEKDWLEHLVEHNLKLPDKAQKRLDVCNTRADFYYTDDNVAVFIDGPVHDSPEIAANDRRIDDCAFDSGIEVIRFHYAADWQEVINAYRHIFSS